MKKMIKKICFLFLMLTLLAAPTVLAAEAEEEYDGYIVCFKDAAAAEAARELIDARPALFSAETEPALTEIREEYRLYKTYDEQLIADLEQAGLVEYSEPDFLVTLFDYDYEADTFFSSQWAHTAIDTRTAWQYGVYGNDVTVAVIDSGVKADHPDLANNILPGRNYTVHNSDGSITGIPEEELYDVTDNVGHGTFVSGIIAAEVNGIGVVGTAHRTKILPLKVTDQDKFPNSYLATAIYDCIDVYDVDVINLSCGYTNATDKTGKAIEDAIEDAVNSGIIVVAAAGNITTGKNLLNYPAAYDNVVSVADLRHSVADDGTYTYSPSSSSCHNEAVNIIAPGTGVRSTWLKDTYPTKSGTSFAAPYVAAVAALAKSVDPDITPAHFMQLLEQTATPTAFTCEEHPDTPCYGAGILNAGALIEALIAEKTTHGAFLSPIDRRADGPGTVTGYNPSEYAATLSVIARWRDAGSRLDIASQTIPLEPYSCAEAVFSEADGFDSAALSCYLLDTRLLRPMYDVRQALAD